VHFFAQSLHVVIKGIRLCCTYVARQCSRPVQDVDRVSPGIGLRWA